MIYLDHNATTPTLPAAARAAADWLLSGVAGNPSSAHAAGRRARALVEKARRRVAVAAGAQPAEVIFTSGATEALHLALGGLMPRGSHVVTSSVEHPALYGAAEVAGARVTQVPTDARGRLDPDAFAAARLPDTALVAVMAAQNELGNEYPVSAIAAAVAPVPVLCDAAQWFGKRPLDFSTSGCAAVVLSAHKIGGPAGVGALVVARGRALGSTVAGGPQERGRRAGTENVAGILGFGAAAEAVPARLAAMTDVERRRDRLAAALRADVPGFIEHGDPSARLPNTLSFRIDGVAGDLLLAALDLEGICVSSGSACSAGALEPSPVLQALGLDAETARAGLRVSLGPETTDAEVDALAELLPRLVARARTKTHAEVRPCA
ncbi:MAG: cysteine desulfurase [Myxococcales bacterium]|nr:cysteine desulfurase [Myxococcales bacterium]